MNESDRAGIPLPESEPTITLPASLPAGDPDTVSGSLEGTGGLPRIANPQADAPPRTLPGIPGYANLEFLARGGMGTVYKAREVNLKRIVAIKVPKAEYCDSPDALQRFLTEAQSAALLEHPNICPVYHVGEFEGRPFIAMGFVEGQTLKAWREAVPPPPKEAARVVAKIARAVDFAHQRKVLHRDLKPSNVMIRREGGGEPVLMDFGLAKNLGEHQSQLTSTGEILGTPAFMAPEQAEGKTSEVGPAADIYALGAILYDLICGRPPFVGSVAEVLISVRVAEPVAPRRRDGAIPRDLETICLKALAKEPSRRYATALELAEDLELFVAGESIRARRESVPTRLVRQARRYPIATALVLLLAVVLATVAGLAPAVLSIRKKSLMLEKLQSLLEQQTFAAQELALADPILSELAEVAREQVAGARQRVHRRLAASVQDALRARQLSPQDKGAIAASFELLASRDPALADSLRGQMDARFQGWNPLAELKAPFTNTAELLPAGSLMMQGEALYPPTGPDINPLAGRHVTLLASSSEDCRLEARFAGYSQSGGTVGLYLKTQGTSGGEVQAVRFSRDGRRLYSGGADGHIHIWDLSAAREIAALAGHRGSVMSLVVHPKLPLLFSCGEDGTLKVWDLDAKKEVRSLKVMDPAADGRHYLDRFPLAISPDGSLLAAAWPAENHDEVLRWKLPDLEPLPPLTGNGSVVRALAFSQDGNLLAAGTEKGMIQIWNSPQARLERSIPAFADSIRALEFQPATNLLAGCSNLGIVRIWNSQQGTQQARLLAREAGAFALAFDRGGDRLAVAYNNCLRIWNTSSRQPENLLQHSPRQMWSVVFSPDATRLAAAGRNGVIHVWDSASGREDLQLGSQGYAFIVSTPRRAADQVSSNAGEPLRPDARLQILRNGQPLAESVVTLSDEPLQVRATLEAGQLRLQVGELPELVFREFIPHGIASGGSFGLQVPQGVGLAELHLDEKPLPAAAGSLERGDRLLSLRRHQEALDLYQPHLQSLTGEAQDSEVIAEIRCKMGICLSRLNQVESAQELYRQVILESQGDEPYPLVAGVQLWLELVRQGDFTEASKVFNTLQPRFTPQQVARMIPLEDRQQVLEAYLPFLVRNNAILLAGSQTRLREGIEIAEFLQANIAAAGNFHLRLIAFERMAGNEAAARSIAEEATVLLEAPASYLRGRSLLPHELDAIRSYGYLCRRIGDPERALRLIDQKLAEVLPRLPPEQQAGAWELLIERACLNVARKDLPAAQKDLERYFAAVSPEEMSYDLHSQAWLLHGFLREEQGDSAGALASWKTASTQTYERSHPGAVLDLEASPLLVVRVAIIGSFADALTDAQAADIMALGQSVTPDAAVKQLLPLALNNPRPLLMDMWRGKRAREVARLAACRELLFPEQARLFAIIAGTELLHQLCLPGELGDEHDALLWEICTRSFEEYSRGNLSLLQLGPLLFRFRGLPTLFSDESLLGSLPSPMRPGMAYLLARRLLVKNNDQAAARTCLGIAIKESSDGSAVRQLAEIELGKLGRK